jgi:hypothetical protein
MNTQEKCQCLVCYKPSSKSMKWAVLGGRVGDLRFSKEAMKLQFDTLSGDPRSPRPTNDKPGSELRS